MAVSDWNGEFVGLESLICDSLLRCHDSSNYLRFLIFIQLDLETIVYCCQCN